VERNDETNISFQLDILSSWLLFYGYCNAIADRQNCREQIG